MRESPRLTSHPFYKRLARSLYWRALALVFRWWKIPISKIFAYFQPRAPWPGHETGWTNLEEYGRWLPSHVRWRSDPLGGAFDIFPTRETIAAQYVRHGVFEEDCDGLAYFSAQNLDSLADDPAKILIITVILDPFSFKERALFFAAHVFLIFPYQGQWRVISNETLYEEHYPTIAEAIQRNPYCASHPILWIEARNRHLRHLASAANVHQLERKLLRQWPHR